MPTDSQNPRSANGIICDACRALVSSIGWVDHARTHNPAAYTEGWPCDCRPGRPCAVHEGEPRDLMSPQRLRQVTI